MRVVCSFLVTLLLSARYAETFSTRPRSALWCPACGRSPGVSPTFPVQPSDISFPQQNYIDDRFGQSANTNAQVEQPCIVAIGGKQYNVTPWVRAHPGGAKALERFHGKDATKAFESAGHSAQAYEMLKEFELEPIEEAYGAGGSTVRTVEDESKRGAPDGNNIPRWRKKLFTQEDPISVHKYCGIFVLLHCLYRYSQMCFGDVSAGFGTRLGRGSTVVAPLCLIPHTLFSLSSLIFQTVPRERVVGMLMIWSEFRMDNIIFALRSVVSTFCCWLSIATHHDPAIRRAVVWVASSSILIANAAADLATHHLRSNDRESTTTATTMPYWDGCSLRTRRKFKSCYAYCQFTATLGCFGSRLSYVGSVRHVSHPTCLSPDDLGAQGSAIGKRMPSSLYLFALRAIRLGFPQRTMAIFAGNDVGLRTLSAAPSRDQQIRLVGTAGRRPHRVR